ncbi:hypothetical protein ACIGJK_14140 [Pseudomonas iridis]|uniref:hypothetical protein n=1 Tax=Pseudomonas iridis TaxID=2710587 RepID=UPI0037CB1FCF
MPWLRGGTVAVTKGSTTVVGTNADFAANAKSGDAFVGPDGANYEIGNVASATVISIIPAYKGPSASGVAYAIMPVQGYPKALADAFSEINRQWGATLSALGTTGNYDILPVTKGGTGAANEADARDALGLGTASTVNIQTSVIDPTAGRAMINGAWGWGSVAADNPTDLNAIAVSQKFGVNTGALNTPWALGSTTVPFAAGSSGIAMTWTSSHQSQIIVNRTAAMVALRRKNAGVWAPDDYFCMYPTGKTCLSVTQGGTGGKTQAEARTGLGLGTAATANIGRQAGQVLGVPFLGLGSREDVGNSSIMASMNVWESSIGVIADSTQFKPVAFGTVLNMSFPGTGYLGSQLYMGTAPGKILGFRSGDYRFESFNIVYHTGNTTRAADGTLKAI